MKISLKTDKWVRFILPLVLADLIVTFVIRTYTYAGIVISEMGLAIDGAFAFDMACQAFALSIGCVVISWLIKDNFYSKIAWSRALILLVVVPMYILSCRTGPPDQAVFLNFVRASQWWLPLISYVVLIPLMLKRESK